MSEIKAAWEPHNLDGYRVALGRDHDLQSGCCIGERFAMVVNCETKPGLIAMLNRGQRTDGDALKGLADFLAHAEESLRTRLQLIEWAFERLTDVSEEIAVPTSKDKGRHRQSRSKRRHQSS